MDQRLSVQLIDNHTPATLPQLMPQMYLSKESRVKGLLKSSPNESEPCGYQYQREITFDIPVFQGIIDTRMDIKGKVYLSTGTTGYFDGSAKAAFSVQALEIVNGLYIEELPASRTVLGPYTDRRYYKAGIESQSDRRDLHFPE